MADAVRDSIHIDAAPKDVFDVATDFESYPEWSASIKEARVESADPEGRATRVWFEVDAKIRVVGYTLAYDYSKAPEALSWDLEGGDVKELSGSYEFEAVDGGTEVSYEARIDPGFPVPGLLKRQAERQIVRGALADLKRRVESLP